MNQRSSGARKALRETKNTWGPKVTRERDTITIHELQHPKSVSQFLYTLHDAIQKGYSEIKIADTVTAVFPNACVPVCGIIDHYKKRELFLIIRSWILHHTWFIVVSFRLLRNYKLMALLSTRYITITNRDKLLLSRRLLLII